MMEGLEVISHLKYSGRVFSVYKDPECRYYACPQ